MNLIQEWGGLIPVAIGLCIVLLGIAEFGILGVLASPLVFGVGSYAALSGMLWLIGFSLDVYDRTVAA
jgi:hypothetical protein